MTGGAPQVRSEAPNAVTEDASCPPSRPKVRRTHVSETRGQPLASAEAHATGVRRSLIRSAAWHCDIGVLSSSSSSCLCTTQHTTRRLALGYKWLSKRLCSIVVFLSSCVASVWATASKGAATGIGAPLTALSPPPLQRQAPPTGNQQCPPLIRIQAPPPTVAPHLYPPTSTIEVTHHHQAGCSPTPPPKPAPAPNAPESPQAPPPPLSTIHAAPPLSTSQHASPPPVTTSHQEPPPAASVCHQAPAPPAANGSPAPPPQTPGACEISCCARELLRLLTSLLCHHILSHGDIRQRRRDALPRPEGAGKVGAWVNAPSCGLADEAHRPAFALCLSHTAAQRSHGRTSRPRRQMVREHL